MGVVWCSSVGRAVDGSLWGRGGGEEAAVGWACRAFRRAAGLLKYTTWTVALMWLMTSVPD